MQKEIQPIAQPGLLTEYGIVVKGTPEAIAELGRMLADRPVGQTLVLMAEQGRAYGVQFFASPRFDARVFVKDAARFRMDEQQAQCFAANLPFLPDRR